MKKNGVLNLEAGIYFINELKLEEGATLNVLSESVILHIGKKMETKKEVTANSGGSVTGLQVYLHQDAEFKADKELDFTGLIYGPEAKKVEIKKDSTFHGSLIIKGEVKLEKDVSITYTAADQAAVNGLSTCTVSLPDHFAIIHDGAGINCQAESITITAHDTAHATVTGYTSTITLSTSTSHGDWSIVTGNGVLDNAMADDGAASYTFDSTDNGQVVLGLKDTWVETVNINVADGGITEQSGSATASEDLDLVFAQAGFNFLADSVANAIGTQIGGKPSNTAPGSQVLEVQAIKTSDSTGACEAALVNMVNIELAFECQDPTTCGAALVDIEGVNIAANPSGSVSSYTSVGLDFGDAADSTATFVLSYPNAGQIRLHARYNIPLESGAASGRYMVGTSNNFVVRPFGFAFTNIETGAMVANPRVNTPAGAVFTPAGTDFAATVGAYLWAAADDTNNDGIPDNGANLTDNGLATSFAYATTISRIAPFEPSGGTLGTLNNGSIVAASFSGGTATVTNLQYMEVGSMTLRADASNYLGTAGVNITGTSANDGGSGVVGRFYANHFEFTSNTPVLAAACNSNFTYIDQPFTFSTKPVITAYAMAANATTIAGGGSALQNYHDFTGGGGSNWWKLDLGSGVSSIYTDLATHAAHITPDFAAASYSPTSGSGTNGSIQFTLDGPFEYDDRAAALVAPVGPFDGSLKLDFTVTDSDTATGPPPLSFNPISFPDPGMRWGRVRLGNGFGSELLPVAVDLVAEYYTSGGYFTTNTNDGCTALGVTDLSLANNVEVAQTDGDVQITAGNTSTATIANPTFVSGDGDLSFSAPGAGQTGYADITVLLGSAGLDWLQFDWDGDGTVDDPTGRVTFGIYSGRRNIIYLREPW